MNFYAISALVNVVTSVVLGFLILFADPKSRKNQLFSLFAFSVSVWGYAYFSWQIATNQVAASFWIHILMAGAIFIPFLYFHFIARFLELHKRFRWAIWIGYVVAIFFSIVNWGPLFISSIGPRAGFLFWPTAGPLFSVFLIIWLYYALYPIFLLFQRLYKSINTNERTQILYILIGTIIGYVGGSTNYFLWYNISILPFGNISASLYIILVAYAILKHGLFSMKVATTEFIVFLLWLFVFVRMILSDTRVEQLVNGSLLIVLLIVGVLLIRSVDKEVEQREKMEELAKELQETNKRQEGLIHFIGHEVKGFLTKAQGVFSLLVEGDLGQLSDTMKPFVERALQDTRDGVTSVSDILKASNLKKGTMTFKRESFDLKELAIDSVEKVRQLAEKKGLKLSFTAEGGDYQMTGDKGEIGDHILRNLIDNSINYTPSGSIDVSLKREKGKFIFVVEDTGVGITNEDKKHLFIEGGHGKDSIKTNVHSTGYGLFIAKQITEAHGGIICADSAGEGKGSVFTVELPA